MEKKWFFLLISSTTCAQQNFEQSVFPIVRDVITLVNERKNNPDQPIPIISIAGCFAVGKSFFTSKLTRVLQQYGIKAQIIREDNFLHFSPVAGANPIHPYLDANRIRTVLSGIGMGVLKVNQPYMHLSKNGYRIKYEDVDYQAVDVILFEGVYSLCGQNSFNFRKFCIFGIFLETSDDNIYAWDWDRNQEKPKTVRKSRKRFKKSFKGCMQNYKQYILPYRSEAKYIVYKHEKNAYTVGRA